MRFARLLKYFLYIMFFCSVMGITLGSNPESLDMEKRDYEQERTRIESWSKSLIPGSTNDLKEYEKDVNGIQIKWSQKKKEYYARLMLDACKPLSSGRFNDERQYDVARRYALSALEKPNEIPLDIELELTGHVMTDTVTPRAPKGQEWTQRRKKDLEVKFHAWKRLKDAIDPNWDPNDLPVSNIVPPSATGLPGGVASEAIKDPKLRAEYETAIEKNRQKAERYGEQYRLRGWLKRFPKRAEEYIIQSYSKPPFDVEELKQYLDKYIADTKTKARILDAVTKNMEKETRKESTTQ